MRYRSFFSFVCIVILLPYVVTVFINGTNMKQISAVYVNYENSESRQQVLWEEYFIGVLAKEIPVESEMDFLKAQAVILRTGLYQEMELNGDNQVSQDYFTKNQLKEKWGSNFAEYYQKYGKAIRETRHEVLRFQGKYALLPFHQSNTGMTRNFSEGWNMDEYPYLISKNCESDKMSEGSLHRYEMSYQEIQKLLQAEMVAQAEELVNLPLSYADFSVMKKDSAGYVTEICVRGTTFSGERFRTLLGLASSAFSFQDGGDKGLVITTAGNGHGLGLSQWTANEMAKNGSTYEEILQYFYEGTDLENVEEIFRDFE